MIWFLALQSAIFAGWATVSASILFGIVVRARASAPLPGPAAQAGAIRGYLTDPDTRRRRRIWVALTAALFLSSLVFTMVLMTL